MTPTQLEVNKLIKRARSCYVRARFGTYEGWVRVSKSDARHLVKTSWCEDTRAQMSEGLTPEECRDLYLS